MSNQFEKVHTRRIVALAMLCIVLFGIGAMRVFDYQIVNGEEYLLTAQKSTFTTVKVTAARGEIVDCNGVPFTQNRAAFNVEFDYAFLKKSQTNQTIYSLIKTFEALNEVWNDDLPITKTQPYEFSPDRESDISRMKSASKLNLNTYATAQNCIDAIYEMAGIKKYENSKGKCTHCKKDFNECDYKGYSEEYSRKIAGVRYQMLVDEFSSVNSRYTFATDIKPETVALIKELSSEFVGVEIAQKSVRTYISGNVASHLIGKIGPMDDSDIDGYLSLTKAGEDDYARNDMVGKSGIEKKFERELRGQNGEMKIVKNSLGDVVDVIETVKPIAGNTVKLTIDFELQKEIQQLLADYIVDYNATNKKDKKINAGAITVLDPKSNAVLACVSYPYYNIEDYYNNYSVVALAEGNPEFNRALTGLYRPGSTFKPIVATGALQEGKITPASKVFCSGSYDIPGWPGKPPGCLMHGHGHAPIDVINALKWSCNIFFYDTGTNLGIDKMEKYANLFGVGMDTGLEIPNKTGYMSSPARAKKLGVAWNPRGDIIQAAIGQLDTQLTPLQMAIEASTIANHGTRYNAHLLKEITDYNQSEVIKTSKPTVASQFNMSDMTFNAVSSGMVGAAQTITGPYQVADLGYSVAIKTGTPQEGNKTNNAFIAFAPVEAPEVAISCMLEDGDTSNKLLKSILQAFAKSKERSGNANSGTIKLKAEPVSSTPSASSVPSVSSDVPASSTPPTSSTVE